MVKKKRKSGSNSGGKLPGLAGNFQQEDAQFVSTNKNVQMGESGPRLEPMEWRNPPPKPTRKRKKGPKFSDQIGVKVSWSTWQWRQGQEKFHNETIKNSTSYVGRQIKEHRDNLEKLNSIFDPQKMKEITKAFHQKMIDRDNLGMLKRLQMIATEKTEITKTNDPYEKRYVTKLRKDKARMNRNSKQYAIDMINFDNVLMLKRLNKTRTSLQSRKGLKRDFKRSRVMKKAMAKVFDPNFQREKLIRRGLYKPVYSPVEEEKKKKKRRKPDTKVQAHDVIEGLPQTGTPYVKDRYLRTGTRDSEQENAEFHYDMARTPGTNEYANMAVATPSYFHEEVAKLATTPPQFNNPVPAPYSADSSASRPPMAGFGKPPLSGQPMSRSSVSTGPLIAPFSRGSVPYSASSSIYSNTGIAIPANLLMKQTGMRIANTGVLVSAYRGPKEALVYEITDPSTGVVSYFDIPATVIYDIGNEFPALLEAAHGSRIEKLATLLNIKSYFSEPSNITAKMYWWHKQDEDVGVTLPSIAY